jgi:Fur family zinc uptake transcriptional regulator|tara:strand:- start:21 stop:410 length:390 start_codon:yes stop_codon:yes gene_type:complete
MKIVKCKLKNDQQVLGILKKNTNGMSAYDVLKEIQKYKNIKPMTIYRSLKNLQKIGVVHKSNQSKNFFLCHSDVKEKHNPALAICKKCEKTEEIDPNIFSKIFNNLKTKQKYDFSSFELEISTTCRRCN